MYIKIIDKILCISAILLFISIPVTYFGGFIYTEYEMAMLKYKYTLFNLEKNNGDYKVSCINVGNGVQEIMNNCGNTTFINVENNPVISTITFLCTNHTFIDILENHDIINQGKELYSIMSIIFIYIIIDLIVIIGLAVIIYIIQAKIKKIELKSTLENGV